MGLARPEPDVVSAAPVVRLASERIDDLESLGAPTKQRLEARLRHWYAAIARYPQLHEAVGAEEYVEMKQREARPAPSG